MTQPHQTLVVCGDGLAGLMVAISLATGLNEGFQIILIEDETCRRSDVYYGSVTAPTGYDFYRSLGLDEPTLFRQSSTSFSLGSKFINWPSRSTSWVQCHHQPFPVLSGVPLQHHLTRLGFALDAILVSAQAANRGVFAHPPQDSASPLSRAEYGYQFSFEEWTDLLRHALDKHRIRRISGTIAEIETEGQTVRAVRLETDERITGDFFVDCTGPSRKLMGALQCAFATERQIAATQMVTSSPRLGPPFRQVEATVDGWSSKTFLQTHVHEFIVRPDGELSISLGRLDQAWRGNCVGIGHAAAVVEPLTPAPMLLLQRDVERLMDLVPLGADMSMECREFNRRFDNDYTHAHLFQSALFRFAQDIPTAYWRNAKQSAASKKLDRKIDQFKSRGLLVKYDLEPFNDEDWLILHAGMGREPERYDRQLDGFPESDAIRQLTEMRRAVEQLVARLPSHEVYVTNMKRYLEKQANV